MDNERLLREREVSAILNISRATVYQMAKRGVIPCVRLGRAVRFPERALQEFIERNAAENAAAARATQH